MNKPQRMAECHPDRPYFAKGLCAQCYKHKHYEENRERYIEAGCKWNEENRERLRRAYHEADEDARKRRQEKGRKYREENQERIAAYHSIYSKEYYKKNRDVYLERSRRANLKQYDITIGEYDFMLEAQSGGCTICGKTPEENGKRLYVDHDHETGEVRGLLCRDCNLLLGFAHDSITTLAHAISYLEENGGPPPPQYKEEDR